MSRENVDVIRELFLAIQRGDAGEVLKRYDPAIVIREHSESLPYGGVFRGTTGAIRHMRRWARTWRRSTGIKNVLRPTFIDAGDRVVVIWRHRAESIGGAKLDAPIAGLYTLHGGLITEAQMFHADTVTILRFLDTLVR
jgi:ketosteroid isomerase-like protein